MARYLARRLLQMIPLVIGITMLTFGIANLVPGSPVTHVEKELRRSPRIRAEDIELIRRHLGLDQPVHVRYLSWAGNVLRGDLGISMRNFQPISQLMLQRLPNTLLLTTSAVLLALLVAIPVGIVSAVKRNSLFDNVASACTVAGYSIPTFWLALMLILLVAIKFESWGWVSLPAGGAYDSRGGGDLVDRLEHLILPVFTLAVGQTAYWTGFVRSQMIELLSLDYMRTARAKGLRERFVVVRHGFRNALLPILTLLGLTIPELFAGALLVEQIFAFPGIGQLTFQAAINKDYPLIMGAVLFTSILVLLGNLLADVAYGWADPRVRFD